MNPWNHVTWSAFRTAHPPRTCHPFSPLFTPFTPFKKEVMDTTTVTLNSLFAQLGLPDDDPGIDAFIGAHRPLPMTVRVYDAPFWSPSQAQLLREKLQEDAQWAVIVDVLNVRLRDHP